MFHHSSCSSIPIDFICVQCTVCIHTRSDIWTPETEISDIKFPFCPSAPHVWRYDVASSCTAHTFTGVASLCWTWGQFMYTHEHKFVSWDNQFPWCLSRCSGHSFTRRVPLWAMSIYCYHTNGQRTKNYSRPLRLILIKTNASGSTDLIWMTKTAILSTNDKNSSCSFSDYCTIIFQLWF
jgi:hypothetical protein